MKKIILLSMFIFLFLLSNVYAASPSAGWNRSKIDKIGFFSGNLNELNLGNVATFAENKLDFVKTLNTPTWVYLDVTKSNIPDPVTLEVISDIPEGEYYVFFHFEASENHNGSGWQNQANFSNVWLAMEVSYNGTCTLNVSSRDLNLNNANFVKVRIQRDTQTNLVQTLLNIDSVLSPIYSYTFSVSAS
jgi:hypothetical protein